MVDDSDNLPTAVSVTFNPSEEQALVKVRLYDYIDQGVGMWTLETMPVDVMCRVVGTRKLKTWLQNPDFAAWLANRESTRQRARALQDTALFELQDLMTNQEVAPKDRLKAIDMLLNLVGAYPTRQKEVRFLDKDLDKMTEADVERELAAAQKRLDKPQ